MPMEFEEFKKKFQDHVSDMVKDQDVLFVVDVDKEEIWNIYLNSFPDGTNNIFKERREFDCSCCRHFIKSFGNVVSVVDNNIVTIWDFETGDDRYQPVVDALSRYIKGIGCIKDVYVTKECIIGTDYNHQRLEDGSVHTWHHFKVDLPKKFVTRSSGTIPTIIGEFRDIKNVFKRSLEEISKESIETVLELIAQKSLYKGEEWDKVLQKFLLLHDEYHKLSDKEKDNYCWLKSFKIGGSIGKIKNHSIGVLLTNISEGMDLNEAVKKYESIVAPSNYKRPKPIFTKKMVEQAKQTITELGFSESLERRFATIDDITINNILFANKEVLKKLDYDVFSKLEKEAVVSKKNFDKVEEVSIETFVKDLLPKTSSIELLFENRHAPNLISLIAPKIADSKTMFKWDNNFSWAYEGNITDSIMKEQVKKLGGRVDGVLRFSIRWNENGDNGNDLDAHSIEPNKHRIYFPNKRIVHPSSGMLDVDIIVPGPDVAVENIIYTDLDKMPMGIYEFLVNVYSYRNGKSGFDAEIEFDDQIYSFQYHKDVRDDEDITVAKIKYSEKGFEMISSLDSTSSSRIIWGLGVNQFYPVSVCMVSPNYWDEQTGIGNKHYIFILNGCKNDNQPRGFFNEFLKEDLLKYKRIFEALGGLCKVEPSNDQLSGLGFSSTKRNSIICKLEGNFKRMIKIVF